MNIDKQNTDYSLSKLAAQREIYSEAKKKFLAQAVISGPIACLLVLVGLISADAKPYIAAWSVIYLIFEMVILVPHQKKLRKDAAKIQELFDVDLYEMEWNSTCCGSKPSQEQITSYSEKHRLVDPEFEFLKNWYPTTLSIANLSNTAAVLICQRTNCWWDGDQRKKYALALTISAIIVIAACIITAIAMNLDFQSVLLVIVLPVLPIIKLLCTQIQEQREASQRLDHLHEEASKIWRRLISEGEHAAFINDLRGLQNEIFNSRSRNQPVIDIIYDNFKDARENEMNVSADQLINQYTQRFAP